MATTMTLLFFLMSDSVSFVDIQGYDYREAATVIGKPLGTVKSRLARARARLRDCLQQYRELLPTAFRLEDETRK